MKTPGAFPMLAVYGSFFVDDPLRSVIVLIAALMGGMAAYLTFAPNAVKKLHYPYSGGRWMFLGVLVAAIAKGTLSYERWATPYHWVDWLFLLAFALLLYGMYRIVFTTARLNVAAKRQVPPRIPVGTKLPTVPEAIQS